MVDSTTYNPYANAVINLLIKAQRPQGFTGSPFNAAGMMGLPGTPSGPPISAPFNWNLNSYLPGGGLGTAQGRAIAAPVPAAPAPPATAAVPAVPSPMASGWGSLPQWLGLTTPAAAAPAPATAAAPVLNQGNPAMTAGVPGLAGGPSGAAVAPPGQAMPTQSQPNQQTLLAQRAAAYRAAHTPAAATGLTTAQLNAQSLAAAQAGRNYWNPSLNMQPGGNVLNALTTPPAAGTATRAAIPTAPPAASAAGPTFQMPTMQLASPGMMTAPAAGPVLQMPTVQLTGVPSGYLPPQRGQWQ